MSTHAQAQEHTHAQAQEKFSVWVLWGEEPEYNQCEPLQYKFNTRAELDAFLLGIEEGDGWFGYDYVEGHKKPSLSEFENYTGENTL